MNKSHRYTARISWSGAQNDRPFDYRSYDRNHLLEIPGKPALTVSADQSFLGDASKHNPEDLLVAALSSCHMLSYLSICARARLTVLSYVDEAEGTMVMDRADTGRFTEVILRPLVGLAQGADLEKTRSFHVKAHAVCFIARSVNFPVRCEPRFL